MLSADEITTAVTTGNNGFAIKAFGIGNEVRGCVERVVLFTDDTTSGFKFFLDNIRVRNTSLFEESGTLKLRYSGGAPVVFHSLMFDAELPEGTDIRFRVKVANSPGLLTRAQFTNALSSGMVFALPGTDAEIDITFLTDNSRTLTPTLKSVTLRLLVDSENHGFIIDDSSEWSLGTVKNIIIEQGALGVDRLILSNPINVGGLYFSHKNAVSEIDEDDAGVFGFAGPKLPISPRQAYNWKAAPFRKFDTPTGIHRTKEKTYLISDRDNDRVIECDELGNFIKGIASSHLADESFAILAACYNPRTGVLTLVATKDIDRNSLNTTNIILVLGSSELPLTASDTLVASSKSKKILEVSLSSDKVSQLQGRTDRVWVKFRSGTFAQGINLPTTAEGLYSINGLSVFIGDLTYTDYIRRPVHAEILASGNWLICNSLVGPAVPDKPSSSSTTTVGTTSAATNTLTMPSLIEIDPEAAEGVAFSYNNISFSDYTLGSAVEYADGLYAVAGIYKSTQATTQSSNDVLTGGFVTVTATFEYSVSGLPTNAYKIEVGDAANAFGVKETTSGKVVLATGTAASSSGVGSYFIKFQGEEGVKYTVVWKVTPTEGGTPIYETREVVGGTGAATVEKQNAGYKGTVVILDRDRSQPVFTYDSPDGLYPSDVDVDGSGNLLIAESDFVGSGGRLVKVNDSGIIVWKLGGGNFGVIRDARSRADGNIVMSM
ncbi:MAG: hypothetical protein HC888_01390 [Candidatus Competibacteraceae bacterium]|nr:hypothetical protein [Candidatus Competibacteraceae bacterium]